MARVDITDVRKSFGAHEVLHGITLGIEDGEFVALVGPSGCGKSTLLRMVAGLEKITAGRVSIGDRVVNDLEPKDRDVAMVFQNYALYPHMTVRENIGFPLRMNGVDRSAIAEAVDRAADILGLVPLLDRHPRHLSGGQRQRVAMGRAIVRRPKAFLFDEPLSNLDAQLRVQMRTELKDLRQRIDTTAIYVTHDQVEAMTMADRIVVMKDGLVEQVGAPLDLYDAPANTFVAKFIGSPSMNLLSGMVDAARRVVMLEGDVALDLKEVPKLPDDGGVVLGFRPEHLSLVSGSGFPAVVGVIEPMGGQTQVLFRFAGRDVVGIFPGRVDLRVGETVGIKPDMELAHLFAAVDGRRLTNVRRTKPVVVSG